MGLLNKAFNRSNGKQPRMMQPAPIVQMRPWNCPRPQRQILLNGNYENRTYIYNTAPIRGIRAGQFIVVEIYVGDATMYSKYSGNTGDSQEYDNVVVMHNNQPIGFMNFPRDKVLEAAKMGYSLRFNARCDGMLENYPDVPDIKVIAPKPFSLYGNIPNAPDDRSSKERDEYFSFYESNPKRYWMLNASDKWVFFDAKIGLIPVKEGSKAKPSIGIVTSDNLKIAEVSARRKDYKRLYEYACKYNSFTVKATKHESLFDDGDYFLIEILAK